MTTRVPTSGKEEPFGELVGRYERTLLAMAFSILGNRVDAEEAVQEAILKAFRARATFRGEAKFSTWLIQITINESKLKMRKDRRHLFQSLEYWQENGNSDCLADRRPIPSEAIESRELRQQLIAALQALPVKYRRVIVLRDIQGLSIEETAEALCISSASVKTRLVRARLKMRDELAPSITTTFPCACGLLPYNNAKSARNNRDPPVVPHAC